jgi:hypothetical protein
LVDDVKDIAMPWRVAPGGVLPGTQALPGVGDRIIRLQPLLGDVEQMHAPGIGVAVFLRGQKVAVSRFGADTGQNRLCAVEKFIVQPGANARQILRTFDHAGLLSGRLEHVMNSADADRPAHYVTHEFDNAEIRTAAHQCQCDDHLAQPSLGDRYLEQYRIVRGGGEESVIQSVTRLVHLDAGWWPEGSGRSGVGAIGDGQRFVCSARRRCRPDASIHLTPTEKSQGVTFRSRPRQPRSV